MRCAKTEQRGEVTKKRETCRVREKSVRFKMPLTTGHTPLSQCLQRICLRAPMRPQFSAVFPVASHSRLYTRREINVSYMLSTSPKQYTVMRGTDFCLPSAIFDKTREFRNGTENMTFHYESSRKHTSIVTVLCLICVKSSQFREIKCSILLHGPRMISINFNVKFTLIWKNAQLSSRPNDEDITGGMPKHDFAVTMGNDDRSSYPPTLSRSDSLTLKYCESSFRSVRISLRCTRGSRKHRVGSDDRAG